MFSGAWWKAPVYKYVIDSWSPRRSRRAKIVLRQGGEREGTEPGVLRIDEGIGETLSMGMDEMRTLHTLHRIRICRKSVVPPLWCAARAESPHSTPRLRWQSTGACCLKLRGCVVL